MRYIEKKRITQENTTSDFVRFIEALFDNRSYQYIEQTHTPCAFVNRSKGIMVEFFFNTDYVYSIYNKTLEELRMDNIAEIRTIVITTPTLTTYINTNQIESLSKYGREWVFVLKEGQTRFAMA